MRSVRRAIALLALVGCGHGRRREVPESCGAPLAAKGEKPARQLVQAQGVEFVHELAISPGGKLVSFAARGSVQIWDVASRRLLTNVPGPIVGANGVSWDGEEVVVWTGKIQRLDLTGTLRGTEPIERREADDGGVEAYSPFGLDAPSGSSFVEAWQHSLDDGYGSELRLDRQLSGTSVLDAPSGPPSSLDGYVPPFERWVLSADGTHLVAWSSGGMEAYGKLFSPVAIWTLGEDHARGVMYFVRGFIKGAVPSRDGSQLYVSTLDLDEGDRFYTYDPSDPDRAPDENPDYGGSSLVVSPTGDVLYVTRGAGVAALRLPSLELAWRTSPSVDRIDFVKNRSTGPLLAAGLVVTPDGRQVVLGRADGSLFAIDAATGREIGALGWPVRADDINVFAVDSEELRFVDDDRVAVLNDDHLTIWSLDAAAPVLQFGIDDIVAVRLADGDLVTVRAGDRCDHSVVYHLDRWDGLAPPADLAAAFEGAPRTCVEPPTTTPDRAPSIPATRGMGVEVVHVDYTADVQEADDFDWSHGLVTLFGHDHPVLDLRTGTIANIPRDPAGDHFPHLDGGVIAEGWAERPGGAVGLRLFDPRTGALLAAIQPPRGFNGRSALVHEGGDRVALVANGSLFEIDADGHTRWSMPLETGMAPAVYTPDDAIVLGALDGSLGVVRDGVMESIGASDGGAIEQIAVSPDGSVAVTRSADGALRVWDLPTTRLRGTLLEFTDDEYLAYLPDGSFTGSHEAAERVTWVFDQPTEAFAFEQFEAFERPDAVRAAMRGDSPPPAPPAAARPPQVGLDAPATGGDTVTVAVTASSPTRVDRVRVFADGRPVAERAICAATGEVRVDVPLLPGVNRMTAVAYDDRGQASNEASTDVDALGGSDRAPTLWIVAVGVSSYPHLDDADQLAFADDDAQALARGLAAHAKRRYRDVRTTVLTDEEVTRDKLLSALRALKKMGSDDLAVVLLAGHGARPSDDEDMRFLTGEASFDADGIRAGGIGWADVGAALSVAAGRVLVLLDACHAGDISQDIVVPNDALAAELFGDSRAGVVVLAASKGRQLSYEGGGSRAIGVRGDAATEVDAARSNGVFTAAVLDALDDPDADSDGDGALELSELVGAVRRRVDAETNGKQTPWLVRKEVVGDFTIVDAAR